MKQLNVLLTGLTLTLFAMLFIESKAMAMSIQDMNKRDQLIVLDEVNKYRKTRGLSPLKLNAYMSQEATRHSQDMASKRMGFGHKGFNERIKRIYSEIKFCRSGSENVAYFKISPREVVKKWLTSPGHRRNIEGPFNLTGIGVVHDQRGYAYYTQIFLRTDNPRY